MAFPRAPPPGSRLSQVPREPSLPYLPARLIVVQVHERPGVLLDLPGIHEDLGEADAVADVGRAATPLPALIPVVLALLLLVATTVT